MARLIPRMSTTCRFSDCGRYRYALEHVFEPNLPLRRVMWIGLHPSLVNEVDRDPTLRRVQAFSARLGYTAFVMTNLFAFRTSRPFELKTAEDPIGPTNDTEIRAAGRASEVIVACWGAHGSFRKRDDRVTTLLTRATSKSLQSLSRNRDGSPKHPLYVRWDTVLTAYPWQVKSNVA
jgi:hypothetical protein